jgi:hypothetical protein
MSRFATAAATQTCSGHWQIFEEAVAEKRRETLASQTYLAPQDHFSLRQQ